MICFSSKIHFLYNYWNGIHIFITHFILRMENLPQQVWKEISMLNNDTRFESVYTLQFTNFAESLSAKSFNLYTAELFFGSWLCWVKTTQCTVMQFFSICQKPFCKNSERTVVSYTFQNYPLTRRCCLFEDHTRHCFLKTFPIHCTYETWN